MIVLAASMPLTLPGCGSQIEPLRDALPPAGVDPLPPDRIATLRAERDFEYRSAPDSPIPEPLRADFGGLAYYSFDPGLQFVVELRQYEDPEPLRMITTAGEIRPAVKMGYVEFRHAGERYRLQVYQLRDMAAEYWGSLFLPFMDQTTGEETYAAGRYLDLANGTDGWYVLDFNLAYHPLCAYGRPGYQCPRTPEENRLTFPVRAGERVADWMKHAEGHELAGAGAGAGAQNAAERRQ